MSSKYIPVDALSNEIDRLRSDHKVIGLCHGCFDVVHFGHLIHFNEAASLVDVLFVSITPDRYVNKGPHRPIFDEQKRLFFLENIQCIDYVTLNDSPDSRRTLSLIRPNKYFKGADYRCSTHPGFLLEQQYCIRQSIDLVHTVGDSFSSTKVLQLLGAGNE